MGRTRGLGRDDGGKDKMVMDRTPGDPAPMNPVATVRKALALKKQEEDKRRLFWEQEWDRHHKGMARTPKWKDGLAPATLRLEGVTDKRVEGDVNTDLYAEDYPHHYGWQRGRPPALVDPNMQLASGGPAGGVGIVRTVVPRLARAMERTYKVGKGMGMRKPKMTKASRPSGEPVKVTTSKKQREIAARRKSEDRPRLSVREGGGEPSEAPVFFNPWRQRAVEKSLNERHIYNHGTSLPPGEAQRQAKLLLKNEADHWTRGAVPADEVNVYKALRSEGLSDEVAGILARSRRWELPEGGMVPDELVEDLIQLYRARGASDKEAVERAMDMFYDTHLGVSMRNAVKGADKTLEAYPGTQISGPPSTSPVSTAPGSTGPGLGRRVGTNDPTYSQLEGARVQREAATPPEVKMAERMAAQERVAKLEKEVADEAAGKWKPGDPPPKAIPLDENIDDLWSQIHHLENTDNWTQASILRRRVKELERANQGTIPHAIPIDDATRPMGPGSESFLHGSHARRPIPEGANWNQGGGWGGGGSCGNIPENWLRAWGEEVPSGIGAFRDLPLSNPASRAAQRRAAARASADARRGTSAFARTAGVTAGTGAMLVPGRAETPAPPALPDDDEYEYGGTERSVPERHEYGYQRHMDLTLDENKGKFPGLKFRTAKEGKKRRAAAKAKRDRKKPGANKAKKDHLDAKRQEKRYPSKEK